MDSRQPQGYDGYHHVDLNENGAGNGGAPDQSEPHPQVNKPAFTYASHETFSTTAGPGYAPIGPSRSTSEKSTEEKKRKLAKANSHNWALEISALVLCLCAVVAIIVLLVYAHGQPLADYTYLISFNAIISILGATARASLAFAVGSCLSQWKWNWFKKRSDNLTVFESFEDASRGPWGSFILMAGFKVRHWAALGALVTVIMLGFEPFLQGVIQYEGAVGLSREATAKNVTPALSRSEIIDAGVYETDGSNPPTAVELPSGITWTNLQFNSQPDLGMSAALYNGFMQRFSKAQQRPSFSCQTGNCTWPIFTSLAVCSQCNDVTSQLKKEKLEGENLGTIQGASSIHIEGEYLRYSLSYVNISNPDVDVVAKPQSSTYTRGAMTSAFMSAQAVNNPGRTVSFTRLDTMLAAMGVIKSDAAYSDGNVAWRDSVVTATECALYLCANAYTARVDGGALLEDIVASWANRVPESYQPLGTKPRGYDEAESVKNHTMVSAPASKDPMYGGDLKRSDLQLRIPPDEARAQGLPDNATLVFNVSQNTIGSTGTFINFDFFQTRSRDRIVWPIAGRSGFDQPPVAQSLWDSQNLTATFGNAALTLSNWMRDYTNTTQAGQAKEYIIYIQVRWEYLTLPLLVVTVGCLFILFSIWETRRLRLPAWRGNVISTLTHSLDAESRAYLRHAERNGHSKETVKATVVYLDNTGHGLELKAHLD